MSNSLIDRFLGSIIKQGQLTITMPSGERHALGTPAAGFPEIEIRLADDKVARDILLDPPSEPDGFSPFDHAAQFRIPRGLGIPEVDRKAADQCDQQPVKRSGTALFGWN